jgi:hypothetical protein
MSFRLFVYYCAVCGGWAGLLGWAVGLAFGFVLHKLHVESTMVDALVRATCVGMSVALSLGAIDGLWNTGGKQLGAVALRAAVGGLAGWIATIPGAFVGQLLVDATGVDALAAFGWTMTGLLIGATVGLYDTAMRMAAGEGLSGAIRKVLNGTIGGFAGGLIGGIIYVAVNFILGLMIDKENSVSGSLIGFVVLGVCIGLAVGLAQVILKEAWVKVESGFRSGREMILTKDETTIGRAESCDIGLFGDNAIERLHARIVQKNNRYVLVDSETPGGTFVNDQRVMQPTPLRGGDRIRLGRAVLRFDEKAKRGVRGQG